MNELVAQPKILISPYLELLKRHEIKNSQKNINIGAFGIQNRRFMGNKYKLLKFIDKVVKKECGEYKSICDIFAGTGVVGSHFNKPGIKVISNDLLHSNYLPLKAFLETKNIDISEIKEKISYLNNLNTEKDNYFSINFGETYFTNRNAKKIGLIREKIDEISNNENEKSIFITSLIYATDKVANTVGHYDAYRKNLDTLKELRLLMPLINIENNNNNEIYNQDANALIEKIAFDILYIDPPYNSRQYSDSYHLLENLAKWEKPEVFGKAKKMDRSHLKSKYCLHTATEAFEQLISSAKCKHILMSYNNTGKSKDGRSNARISDEEIIRILERKGKVKIFQEKHKAFTTGKSKDTNNEERIFYCKIH